jgi:hypothetical protein
VLTIFADGIWSSVESRGESHHKTFGTLTPNGEEVSVTNGPISGVARIRVEAGRLYIDSDFILAICGQRKVGEYERAE